jgi:glycine cleavage system protein P-like pyridoxal-binding family
VRPYLRDRVPKPRPGSGFVYDITIVTRHLSRFFDYERILKYTQSRHKFVLHVMLDSFQHNLRITFPSTVTPTAIIESIERFEHVAHNNYSIAPLVPLTMQTKEEQSPQDSWLEHEARNRPFQVIASRWPHYVVPPSHPFTFLDGECPCSFFGQ